MRLKGKHNNYIKEDKLLRRIKNLLFFMAIIQILSNILFIDTLT